MTSINLKQKKQLGQTVLEPTFKKREKRGGRKREGEKESKRAQKREVKRKEKSKKKAQGSKALKP